MKMKRLAVFAIIILVAILVCMGIISIINMQHISTQPFERPPAKPQGEPHIYSIPENIIPTVETIEESMRKAEKDKKLLEKNKPAPFIETQLEEGEGPKPETGVEKTIQRQSKSGIPTKKEVKFPTYEGRKALESQTGTIAY